MLIGMCEDMHTCMCICNIIYIYIYKYISLPLREDLIVRRVYKFFTCAKTCFMMKEFLIATKEEGIYTDRLGVTTCVFYDE